ncbi:excisionase family DNA binding protein [Halanaerobium saccharolyticum]|uniref:Excisionase family DNA binding protein n=1 Tax=Halanaerobium saccharolyticum TaxID=43595 RepID=A0A4R7Z6X9_9FIRM|nr:helix-turn-helix domain-containing protein [Halanaerobium saccharolyticum]RAK09303.1 excisionase family DNA binding protein [Halanaerobium saccharolyticum]TDW06162.1 excisionase family DNA binding protein [Halanaerobium saccharolyticum]TDX60956.1 excisionase family DNA binding protein [Halanaerobium saccharolyticum]
MKVYTTDEVASMLKISRNTVLNLINKKELKAKKVARKWRVTEGHLQDFFRDQKS